MVSPPLVSAKAKVPSPPNPPPPKVPPPPKLGAPGAQGTQKPGMGVVADGWLLGCPDLRGD